MHTREKCSICTITSLYFLPLSPRYEAIHHKALDSEEIILYIEGQCCHLEKKAQFNHLPIFALNKGQCYFYHSVAVGGKEGDRNSQRDSPRTAVIYRLRALPRESAQITLKWLKLLDLNEGVHVEYTVITYRTNAFFFLWSSAGHIYSLCWLWYVSNVTITILFYSFSFRSHCVALWLQHMPGIGDICHVANNVSRIFSRSWWYHHVAVSMRALQRERD